MELFGRGKPFCRILIDALQDNRLKFLGVSSYELRRRPNIADRHQPHNFQIGVRIVHPMAGCRFVEKHAQRINIRASIEVRRLELFGAHVGKFAFELPLFGVLQAVFGLCDTKIANLDVPLITDEHILR